MLIRNLAKFFLVHCHDLEENIQHIDGLISGEIEREREKQTDRQTDRQIGRQRQRQKERLTDTGQAPKMI
jgi:hypothetical protein